MWSKMVLLLDKATSSKEGLFTFMYFNYILQIWGWSLFKTTQLCELPSSHLFSILKLCKRFLLWNQLQDFIYLLKFKPIV